MKNNIFYGILCLLLIGCYHSHDTDYLEKPQEVPFDYMFMKRAYPTGEVKTNASREAIRLKQSMSSKKLFGQAAIWELVGPENIGGRITDIEIPIDESQVYYVGTASGGIFKTTNGGESWDPIFDEIESLSIGDIEISKENTNVIWVGTGEVNAGGNSLAYDGNGVYYSTDGGLSWTSKGLTEAGSISKVLIDPNDNNTIFVSAMGPLFKNDENRGIYKTVDNGSTWDKVFFASDSTGVIDMVFHPTNSNVLYAAAWERIRRPQYRSYGGQTSGIFKSSDGGNTWSELTNGLPREADEKGRISIDISQSNPDVLYARYANARGTIQGIFKTNNGGDTWNQISTSSLTTVTFHWWFRGIVIDPRDENVIYNVDLIPEKSIDGGETWQRAFGSVHVDQHALAFNTVVDNEILLGNDGGVYKSIDNGETSTKYENLPITQFYRFYVDPQNINKVYGGSQDNGSVRTTTGSKNDWARIWGGDGFQTLVDPNNTNVIYALSQFGELVKTDDDGQTLRFVFAGGFERAGWDTPIVFDPNDSQTLLIGTQRVWKTTDGADDWQFISPDLTNGAHSGNLTFGTITSIDISPINSDFIVIGTDDSNVWITQNGGTNWTKISDSLPNLWTTKVLADRDDENSIYVSFSGYRYGSDLGHIFKSTDAGASWTDIGTDLPDIPVNDIVKDRNGNLFVATDIGVFFSDNDGLSWSPFGENMPSVVVTDLHIHEGEELLFAATYGRSAYKADISNEVLSSTFDAPIEGLNIYPNPASELLNISLSESFSNATVIFYDSFGRIVYNTNFSGNDTAMDISHLNSGIYYVRISIPDKSAVSKLVVH